MKVSATIDSDRLLYGLSILCCDDIKEELRSRLIVFELSVLKDFRSKGGSTRNEVTNHRYRYDDTKKNIIDNIPDKLISLMQVQVRFKVCLKLIIPGRYTQSRKLTSNHTPCKIIHISIYLVYHVMHLNYI